MKRLMMMAALCAAVTLGQAQAPSQTKKELVQKVLQLQQPMIEGVARSIVERPAGQLMQAAGQALQSQVPPDRREAVAKAVEADVRKYVEEATPLLRERALKLAPSTLGAGLEEKFSEEELRQLIAWLESPLNRKFQQVVPVMLNGFGQKLDAEAAPLLTPKLQALQQKMRTTLGIADSAAPSGATAASAATAKPAASGAKPRK